MSRTASVPFPSSSAYTVEKIAARNGPRMLGSLLASRRSIAVAIVVLATFAVLAVNFFLQPRPLSEWIPAVVLASCAAVLLLLLNLAWASSLRAVVRGARERRN